MLLCRWGGVCALYTYTTKGLGSNKNKKAVKVFFTNPPANTTLLYTPSGHSCEIMKQDNVPPATSSPVDESDVEIIKEDCQISCASWLAMQMNKYSPQVCPMNSRGLGGVPNLARFRKYVRRLRFSCS